MHYINTGTRISEAAESLSLLKTKLLQNKMSGNNESSGTSGAGAGQAPSCGGTSSGSTKGGGSMKAPGQDFRISRDGFEKNAAGYFRDLHKK